MHRYHLAVMLYEPRRRAIYADDIGRGGFIAGRPGTASSGCADGVDVWAGRAGRKRADLLEAPGVPAGAVPGSRAGWAETHRLRGLQLIQQIARMRGGAFAA
jgi:hypothetical protein